MLKINSNTCTANPEEVEYKCVCMQPLKDTTKQTAKETQKLGYVSWQAVDIILMVSLSVKTRRDISSVLLKSTGQLASNRRKMYNSQSLPERTNNSARWMGL